MLWFLEDLRKIPKESSLDVGVAHGQDVLIEIVKVLAIDSVGEEIFVVSVVYHWDEHLCISFGIFGWQNRSHHV